MRTLLAALLLGGLIATTAAATAQGRPTLRVVDKDPLVVRATGFTSREHVTLRATWRAKSIVRRVRSGPGGGFTIRFAGTQFDFCAGFTSLRATGARSGTVVIRPTIRPCVHLAD